MLNLSDILIADLELASFIELTDVVKQRAREGEMFLNMDVKPQFKDTPTDWQDRLEAAFTSVRAGQ
jgi:hypothetical protein